MSIFSSIATVFTRTVQSSPPVPERPRLNSPTQIYLIEYEETWPESSSNSMSCIFIGNFLALEKTFITTPYSIFLMSQGKVCRASYNWLIKKICATDLLENLKYSIKGLLLSSTKSILRYKTRFLPRLETFQMTID